VRAGIQSVPRGQVEAATATGLSKNQLMRHVVLPASAANMIPALVTQFIVLLKDTSLASIIGYVDLTKAARSSTTANPPLRALSFYRGSVLAVQLRHVALRVALESQLATR